MPQRLTEGVCFPKRSWETTGPPRGHHQDSPNGGQSDVLGGGFSKPAVFLSVLPSREQGENDVTKAQGNREEPKTKDDRETGRGRGWEGPVRVWPGWRSERPRAVSTRTAAAVASAGVPLLGASQPPEATIVIPRLTGQGRKADGDRAAWQGRSRLEHTRDRSAARDKQPASRAPNPVVSEPHACWRVSAVTGARTSESPSQRRGGVGGVGDDLRGDGDGLATLGRGRKLDARDTQPEWDCDRGQNVKSRSSRR